MGKNGSASSRDSEEGASESPWDCGSTCEHVRPETGERDRKTRFRENGIVIALVLLPLVFWWRLWAFDLADRAVIGQGDLASQYYPLQLFAARELAAGRLPGWDPYINAGQPGLADIQSGFFYPLNLLLNSVAALLGVPFGVEFLTAQIVFHFSPSFAPGCPYLQVWGGRARRV
jgi:hypothetical protein